MGIRLITVDDAPFILETLKSHLESPEFDIVAEATNGEEAVQLIKKHQPDVVIMDMIMPKKNGLEAMDEIFAENKTIKIIACSTIEDPAIVKEAMANGCVDYILKPFTKNQIKEAVQRAFKATHPTQR